MTFTDLLNTILQEPDRDRRWASLAQLEVCCIELCQDLQVSPSIQWALERWVTTRVAYHPTHGRAVSSDLADIMDYVDLLDQPNEALSVYRVKPSIHESTDDMEELARVEALCTFTLDPLTFPS